MRIRRSGVAVVAVLTAVSGLSGAVLGAVPASAASPDSRAPIVTELVDTAGGVRVGFKDRSVDEDAFTLFRRGLNGSWEYVVETPTRDRPGQRAQGELVDPTPNALRCYAVTAYDNAGGVLLQSRSECVGGGFDPFDPLIARTTSRIAAPGVTHVQVLGQGGGLTQVRVRYVDRSTNESRFKLFRRSGPADGNHALLRETTSQRRTTVGQLLSFDDSVPTGTNPCYTVQALDDTTTLSNLSNEVCLTPLAALPAPPPGRVSNNIAYADYAAGSVVLGADGLPISSHLGPTGPGGSPGSVLVTHCNDAACATATTTELGVSFHGGSSLAIGRDGLPIVSYLGPERELRVVHCTDRACRSTTNTTLDPGIVEVGHVTQISIGSDGLATIAYAMEVGSDEVVLKVAHCRTVACPSATISTIGSLTTDTRRFGNSAARVATATSPAGHTYIATSVIAFGANPPPADQRPLKVTTCLNPTCTSRTTHPVDWELPGEVGNDDISIAVGRDGRPVLSYYSHGDLKFAQCVNILCTGVTTRVLDATGAESFGTAIAVGADGLPVIAYERDHGDSPSIIKFAHCAEPACRHASLVPILDGESASIAIGADGLPVIGYEAGYRNGLGLLHCRDVLCSGGPFPGPTGPVTGIGGKCVDVLWALPDNGTPIQLLTCSGHQAQEWTVGPGGRLRALGKCLDITGGATANGTPIQLYDCNGLWAQVWVSGSDGTLRNPESGKCLDTADHGSGDLARLVLWDCTPNTPSQRWTLPTS